MNQNQNGFQEEDDLNEPYPVEPRYHPIHLVTRKIYDFLASARLAMFLLVIILACCVAGVTIVRDKQAWDYIFSTLWFNSLLVLLVVNVACCFFGRIWGRKLSVISFGMILFHMSFVVLFLGIVYNSLYYFRAEIRMTEGETLPNHQEQSYDKINHGRLFSMTRLRGETTLNRMHTGYKADGNDKRAAYDISVGEGALKRSGIIYPTRNLSYRGFTYYPNREGYSALVILSGRDGKEIYGAHLPLQSLPMGKDSFLYTNGTKDGPGAVPFPLKPQEPAFSMNIAYTPGKLNPRSGEIRYQLYPLGMNKISDEIKPIAEGSAPVGSSFSFSDYRLSTREIRYWVVMEVRYEPGKPIILISLWVGFAGMVITTLARIFRKPTRRPEVTG